VFGVFVALVVALLGGWLWGVYGKAGAERALEASALRNDLLEARGSVLAARLDLYSLNFGEASRHLEDARAQARRAEGRLKNAGREDDLGRLQPVFARVDEAQSLAGKLDQGANARAAEAARILEDLLKQG
jgi:hypothetical protein